MYSSKDAANSAYPTQWALNPTAYQNVDTSQVDWAALAQQWIAMKEAAAVMAAPPPPAPKPDEEGEAPMEVENADASDSSIPPGAEWNAATNSWSTGWNQWGWGWPNAGPVDQKIAADPTIAMAPLIDSYPVPTETTAQVPGYTTAAVPTPTFQHGYWTAPQATDQQTATNRSNSVGRDRRSKSKNREHKVPRVVRPPRDKIPMVPPVVPPLMVPPGIPTTTIDAAKRRQLPAWIREGLEKMEREKQRAIEREQEMKAREEAEIEKKRLEELELERLKAEAGGQPVLPPKSKFESDSEGEENEKGDTSTRTPAEEEVEDKNDRVEVPTIPLVKKSKEEIMQEIMVAVRRSLTEILLEVTDHEIHTVSQEEYNRYTAAQASRLNAMKASQSKALAAIASGLGLGAYESSSGESGDEEETNDLSDQQLQDIIRRKRQEFERTARDIEAEVRRAEAREIEDPSTPHTSTPEKPRRPSRSSVTPPPIEGDTPEKLPEQRITKDKKQNHKGIDRVDGNRRLETIVEEKTKKSSKRDRTPSPKIKLNSKGNTSTSSDSEEDSSTTSSDTSIEQEVKEKSRKRKRRNSYSSDSQKKKKDKRKKSHKEEKSSKYYDDERSDRVKSKKKDDRDRHKSSKSRDYDRHKEKYREDSEEERSRKRSRRSRSGTYESRSGRRSDKRSYERRDRSYERRDRSYDRSRDHDRYERSREYERRRSRSGSHPRHRR